MTQKKETTIVPILIVPQPIQPGTGADIPGAEVGVVFCCATCGRPIGDMAKADLVISLDPDAAPGASLDRSDDFQGQCVYEIEGTASVVHGTEECDDGAPGVRIGALRWIIKGGRTQFRPRIRPHRNNGKPKESKPVN